MPLEHALLVALREKPGSGLELTRRFERSFGYFWHATHQQIYRVLARMVTEDHLDVEVVGQSGRPDLKVYRVTSAGEQALAEWLASPSPVEPLRSDLAVRMRGASYGERAAVLESLRGNLADHRVRLAHYRQLAEAYDDVDDLTGPVLDQYLVLRGGIRLEEFWIGWITEYLRAHGAEPHPTDDPISPISDQGETR